MSEHYDVVIVGGAAMGSATAFFLARNPDFSGRVLVVEKDPSYEFAASSRSTSGFRQQFSTPVNIALARWSASFLLDAAVALKIGDEVPDIGAHEAGYLYLGGPHQVDAFSENHRVQRELGVDVALLSPGELAWRYPWLSLDDVAIGSLGLSGEGWFDGYSLMSAFRRGARALGIEYLHDTVTGLTRNAAGRFDVMLASGGKIGADHVVNCAGTAAPEIAARVGISLPVEPVKQSVFAFSSPFSAPGMPYLFTPDGLFCRPEGRDYIAGICIADDAATVAADDMAVDYAQFDEQLWPLLARRAKGFEQVRFKSAWAGHYDMCRFDHNPFIGAVDGAPGFYVASGFSGHGIMQSPGVGMALSELIVYGAYLTLDLAQLGHTRLAASRPVFEQIQY